MKDKVNRIIAGLKLLGVVVVVLLSYVWIGNYFYFKETTPNWVKESLSATFAVVILLSLVLSAMIVVAIIGNISDDDE